LNAVIVVRREESNARCDFQLNLDLRLESQRDIEMIQKYGLPLASFPFADIRGD
jgi:hypothetical protein